MSWKTCLMDREVNKVKYRPTKSSHFHGSQCQTRIQKRKEIESAILIHKCWQDGTANKLYYKIELRTSLSPPVLRMISCSLPYCEWLVRRLRFGLGLKLMITMVIRSKCHYSHVCERLVDDVPDLGSIFMKTKSCSISFYLVTRNFHKIQDLEIAANGRTKVGTILYPHCCALISYSRPEDLSKIKKGGILGNGRFLHRLTWDAEG